MKKRENEMLETFRNLSENKQKAIFKEAAKRQAEKDKINKFHEDYHIRREMRNRNERTRSQLMEGARDNALATVIKAIYITALEQETLTDEGLLLAESMVDTWIKENGGANKILSKVGNNTYLLSRITQIVEDAAEEEVDDIESDEDTDIEDIEAGSGDIVDQVKDFLASADQKEVEKFAKDVKDAVEDRKDIIKDEKEAEKANDDAEKAQDKADKANEKLEKDKDKAGMADDTTGEDIEDSDLDDNSSSDSTEELEGEDISDDSDGEQESDNEEESSGDDSEAEDTESDDLEISDSGEDGGDDVDVEVDNTEVEDTDPDEEEDDALADDFDDEETDDVTVEDEDDEKDPDIDDSVEDDIEEPDDEEEDEDITIDGDEESDDTDDAGESHGKVFDELEKEDDVKKAIELIRSRVADAEQKFIQNNAEDKKKVDELLNKISSNIQKVEDMEDSGDEDGVKTANESVRFDKRRIDAIRNKRPLTVFECMTRKFSAAVIKDNNAKEHYLNESGKIDTELVVESAKVMYGFLETINTLQLEKVDANYIKKVLNDM